MRMSLCSCVMFTGNLFPRVELSCANLEPSRLQSCCGSLWQGVDHFLIPVGLLVKQAQSVVPLDGFFDF